eukprot:CAMPEP_0170484376 /NCGR_PEP_ID=MMETSP0208-20121228/3861_1 /TAXON_ID=197538 /ORGANISM="Strombidium inclinatum, Strain S3" /LENGTH=130 /DNA_ID=CAMNT_0010757693 /DNA_START=9 /DNA_END=401 /DNA_ORIENTATION=-
MESQLTDEHIRKLTKLFDNLNAVDPTYDTQGLQCFEKIFEIAPEALQLYPFRHEKGEEYVKKLKAHASGLFKTLDKVIRNWGKESTDEDLNALGCRHVNYSVIEPHFEIVGMAITETMHDLLKAKFTPEL